MLKEVYYLKRKKVEKIGNSYYKDSNKLGKRKSKIVLLDVISKDARKYNSAI